MATQTAELKLAPESRPVVGHHCPVCGEESTLRLDLADGDTLSCSANDCEVSAQDLRGRIAAWTRLLDWIDLIPREAE